MKLNPQHTTVHVTRRLDPCDNRRRKHKLWWGIGYHEAWAWKPDPEDFIATQDWMTLAEVKHD